MVYRMIPGCLDCGAPSLFKARCDICDTSVGSRAEEGWDGGLLYKLIGNPEAEEAVGEG